MKTVIVKSSKEYAVFIGQGLINEAGIYMSEIWNNRKCAVISDCNVFDLYGEQLESSLVKSGFEVCTHILSPGESSKCATNLIEILEFLARNEFTRTDILVAFGGGVVGDIAGLAASLYLRGIEFVQIPTTILSAVDSSVGGKTAIDLEGGKNLAGAFYQPSLVLCDICSFNTLSEEIVADGYAEIIKYGAICDGDLLYDMDKISIEKIIYRCVSIKRDIVQLDEKDTGIRAILNFGHTVGHAVESVSEYKITHGHAVAIGIAIISRAAEKHGLCEIGTSEKLISVLKKYNLPCNCIYATKDLISHAVKDKKRSGDTITLIIPKKIGVCEPYKIKIAQLYDFIETEKR